ncbi:MliC family protein [Deinococcus planocerae]|uniref:MliC family protein n=1 Tax=Deinococcus planocerae TaxID=1737569 RepID=UPI000C7F34E2|nr:MliC family protein [Deinococcus planocerae]
MKPFTAVVRVGLCSVVLLPFGGTALADGLPAASSPSAGGERVLGRATFRCQGGIRVQVTLLPNRARVQFAGQTRVLNQADGAGGVLYQGGGFAWVSNGEVASMKETRSGRFALRGCVQVN